MTVVLGGSEERSQPGLVLLLGAGASVAAGVPTTVQFVDEFLREVKTDSRLKTLVKKLRKSDHGADVEQLLRVLRTLSEEEADPGLMFFQRRAGLPAPELARRWRKDLELFIKKRCFVPAARVGFLEPLKRLLANYLRPLEVFTVNYDTSVEVFCLTRGVQFSNGFRGVWQPDVLRDSETDIRLYKIHGSVTWWSTDEGTIVEIPVRLGESETQLYYGARARTLIIYPYGPSKGSPRPAMDLLPFFREALRKAAVLIVAGYSFRDEEIRDRVLDAMRLNPNLSLVLIGPSAYQIYESRLKWAAPRVPSGASKRTAILPFPFESVLPHLQDKHLRQLTNGNERYRELIAAEVRYGSPGEPMTWAYACESLVEGGSLELAIDILDRSELKMWPFENHMRAVFLGAAFSGWAGAKQLQRDFDAEVLNVIDRLSNGAKVRAVQDRLSIEFALSVPNRSESPRNVAEILRWFRELRGQLLALDDLTRQRIQEEKSAAGTLLKRIDSLIEYFANNWDDAQPRTVGFHLKRWGKVLGGKGIGGGAGDFVRNLEKNDVVRATASQAEGEAIRKVFRSA